MEISEIKAELNILTLLNPAQNGNDYEINFPISGNVGCKREREKNLKNAVEKLKIANDFLEMKKDFTGMKFK